MLAGFVEPSAGRIVLGEEDIARTPPARRNLGVVFQSYALFPHMTVAENVAFGLQMRGLSKVDAAKRVSEALDSVRLGGLADRYPRQLSGGQQQRVALARALVIRPRALLLDEPLSNLDAKLRDEMHLELRSIHRQAGVTALMVTHDQGEAMALADRIAIMNAGKLEQVGPPEEVYDRPATAFVAGFLGRTNLLDAAALQQHLGIPAGVTRLWSLRPEQLRLGAAGSDGLQGRIVARVFQGGQVLLELDCPFGRLISVQPASAMPLREGEAVGLHFEPTALRPLAEPAS
jgi:putative spermidine/putrescine transport system ATP-binding protein